MRLERHTFLFDFPEMVQAENLIAAAVGKDRLVPSDELVQSTGRLDDLCSWPEIQMVRVSQDDLGANLGELALLNSLDAPLCSDRHEHWRLDGPVSRFEHPSSGITICCQQFKLQLAPSCISAT